MNKKFYLNQNWEFALSSKIKNQSIKGNKWYDAVVPGTVYHNLINNGLIPDPFIEDNELKLQWAAESDWTYRTTFKIPENIDYDKPVILVFEGLDTAAEVVLNGKTLGMCENMFLEYKYDITPIIEKKNLLEVKFTSAYRYARDLEKKYGKLPVALASERVYIRKAQYSFGWDWGPSFADQGIWKNVYLLQEEDFYITGFRCSTKYIQQESAGIDLKVNFNKNLNSDIRIKVNISDNKNESEYELKHQNESFAGETVIILNPVLWWPNGEGEQHLYNVKITLLNNGVIADEIIKQIGIRTLSLQLNDDGKNTFRFIVNGRRIFAKGANWIPADSFLTRSNEAKYRALLTLAKEANMNFVRVWGGGIYEYDYFYSLCDELGLLVWQDFMFACASYPEYDQFLDNITSEISQNVLRLQYHPSIAIWCGNNENEWIWYQEQKKSYTEMPGCLIYKKLIPSILEKADSSRPYWESSPFNNTPDNITGDDDPNLQTSGNRHQWDLWSKWIDYKMVSRDNSLFVTEFGFQGPANQSTFEKVIPSGQRHPQSYLFEFHNKQVEGNERQFKFLAGHLPVHTGWKDFIYLAQLSQGLALKTCLEHWRLNYPITNGSIIWQLNDCWPVSSWALIDSELKPKLAYYMVGQSFRQQILIFKQKTNKLELYHLNSTMNPFKGYAEISEINIVKGKAGAMVKVKLLNTGYKELIYTIPVTDEMQKGESVLTASLYNEKGTMLHRAVYNSSEWKYMRLPEVKIKLKLLRENKKYALSLRSDKPAFFVSLFGDDLYPMSNSITLLPGEEIVVSLKNETKPQLSDISVFTINDYLVK